MDLPKSPRERTLRCAVSLSAGLPASTEWKFRLMEEKTGRRENSEKTVARTPSGPGKHPGPQGGRGVIRWRCVLLMKKETPSPTSRSGILEAIFGIALSGRKS